MLLLSCTGCITEKKNNINNNEIIVDRLGSGMFISIQDAIDNCDNKSTIKVLSGTYKENIKINKPISLISENPKKTIIQGNFTRDVILIKTQNVLIDGFIIEQSGMSGQYSDYDVGIDIESNNSTIKNCVFQKNNGGIEIRSNNNLISNCVFKNNSFGIYSLTADDNIFLGNVFNFNEQEGLYIYFGVDNEILSGNEFKNNEIGAKLKNSQNNKIVQNIFSDNKQGLYFCCGSKDNIIYNNSFINNSKRHVFDLIAMNIWYDSDSKIGNYWDDFNGVDLNDDGIGDSPYNISNNKNYQDKYPLVNPQFR